MAKLKKANSLSLTPNAKIVRVNKNIGAGNISNQQGTTRIIYDSIKIETGAATTYNFFENVNSKKFPFTNLNQNKLQVGETLALERYSMFLMTVTTATGEVSGVFSLDSLQYGLQGLYKSELSFQISQDTVIKKAPLTSMFAPFNKDAKFAGQLNYTVFGVVFGFSRPHDVYHFDNPIVIPPDIEFVAPVQTPKISIASLPAGQDVYLVLSIEGLGSLFSPKTTY